MVSDPLILLIGIHGTTGEPTVNLTEAQRSAIDPYHPPSEWLTMHEKAPPELPPFGFSPTVRHFPKLYAHRTYRIYGRFFNPPTKRVYRGPTVEQKLCTSCHQMKPIDDFHMNRLNNIDSRNNRCKKCHLACARQRYHENKNRKPGVPRTRKTPCRFPEQEAA